MSLLASAFPHLRYDYMAVNGKKYTREGGHGNVFSGDVTLICVTHPHQMNEIAPGKKSFMSWLT
jgi:hypothetical protein